MSPDAIPTLPRGVRTYFDKVRNVPVLLGPERVLMLDQIGDAVLNEVDGKSSITAISARLAAKYNAPEAAIKADVTEYLVDLANKGLVDMHHD
ncbi:MAG: pyrroloquinoline quinone biosynthesis peptide chaperone PqqD [Pseudomonadota bacterium]